MIKRRRLGNTNIYVSEIGLGGYSLGEPVLVNGQSITSFGGMGEKKATNIIHKAVELGINTFDTADLYSLGSSEIRLGKALKKYRTKINIFTKGGYITTKSPSYDISYNNLMASIDRSLHRLQTDYVDLFQVHVPPKTEKEFENVNKALRDIKSKGKARYCGIAIGIKYELGEEIIKRKLADAIQFHLSLIDVEPLKKLLSLIKKNNIGAIVSEPLAQGLLTNKYKIGHSFPKDDLRAYAYTKQLLKKKLKLVQKFKFLINKKRTLSQVALAYVLSIKEVSTCIPGAKSIKQLVSNASSSKIKLSKDELKKIKEIQKID